MEGKSKAEIIEAVSKLETTYLTLLPQGLKQEISSKVADSPLKFGENYGFFHVIPPRAYFERDLTISLWMKSSGKTTEQSLVDHRSHQSGMEPCPIGNVGGIYRRRLMVPVGFHGFQIRVEGQNFPLDLNFITSSGAEHHLKLCRVIEKDVWYHIAVSHDQTKKCIYLNGVLRAEENSVQFKDSVDRLTIGHNNNFEVDDKRHLFEGEMCKLGLWNKSLKEKDIVKIMEGRSENLGEEDVLVYWPLRELEQSDVLRGEVKFTNFQKYGEKTGQEAHQ